MSPVVAELELVVKIDQKSSTVCYINCEKWSQINLYTYILNLIIGNQYK